MTTPMMRCEHRRTVIQALGYDSTRPFHELVGWITSTSTDPDVHIDRDPGGSLRVSEHSDGSRRETVLRPGDIAVQTPTSRYGWDAVPADRFRRGFTVLPRECPVYETNDTAE